MSTHSNGGPAFPSTERDQISGQIHDQHMGMTLRDYFAAKAMQALISREYKEDHKRGAKGVPLMTAYAYEYADAMLAERAK